LAGGSSTSGVNGTGTLQRRLGVGDAVVIGAGSMIGAGVFVAWAPAAGAAGTGLLIGLALAAIVAFCNATSSAQLAAVHPESGGTFVYGRRQLGPGWGHLAGWGFVVGKTASCAAMAMTVGAYLWPERERTVAIAAVVAITVANLGGLTRTVAITRILLVISLSALAAVVVAGWSSPEADLGRLTPIEGGPLDVMRSAGFLFFAFAGYARIATLGEEVRNPETTIPKAIPRALIGVLGVYTVVGTTALATVDSTLLASTDAPLRLVADAGNIDVGGLVRIGAGIAALAALLNLIPGVSRTTLAMARQRDLPRWLAHIEPQRSLPVRAELSVAAVVITIIAIVELHNAIAISGVAVLTYYAITNAAALTLTSEQRRWSPTIAVVGLIGCVALIASLPPIAILAGTATLVLGVVVRVIAGRVS
jgi:basic amino acid/polyamine antiporter, APA family